MREGECVQLQCAAALRRACAAEDEDAGDEVQAPTPTNLDGEDGDVKAVARAKVHARLLACATSLADARVCAAAHLFQVIDQP